MLIINLTSILILLVKTPQLAFGASLESESQNDDFAEESESDLLVERRSSNPDYPISEYLEKCGKAIDLGTKNTHKFYSPYFGTEGKSYPSSLSCQWDFIGEKDCVSEFTCKTFQLAKGEGADECNDEYLEVSDGVGGSKRYCGDITFDKPIKASNGLKDLYIKFKSGDSGTKGKGFQCVVTCSAHPDKAEELPIAEQVKEEPRCVCGLQNKDDRIVGGEDAKLNEFPWQVAMVFKGTRSPKCGGSVINDRYILSATHCFFFDNTQAKDIEILIHARLLDMTKNKEAKDVALGEQGSIQSSGYKDTQLSDDDEKTQRFGVVEVIRHPLFTRHYDYDVALLKLDRKIDLTHPDAPTPICLPDVSIKSDYVGKSAWVVGWGYQHQDAGGTTRLLQKLEVPVIKLKTCQSWSPFELTRRMLCAGYEEGEKDACTGDSGGPLSFKKPNNQWEQIGIVSWGEGCARKKRPGVYSRVHDLYQWIRKHTSDAIWCKSTKD